MSVLQPVYTIQIEYKEQYDSFCKRIEQHLKTITTKESFFLVKLAVYEALNNAFEHGEFPVKIEFSSIRGKCTIKIADSGRGFAVKEKIQLIASKGIDQLLEEGLYNERGRGIFIMYKTVKNVMFNDKGNEVTFLI